MSDELTHHLLRLAAKMLDEHSDIIGRRSCNDFDMKDSGIPDRFWEEIVKDAETENHSPEEYTPGLPTEEYRYHLSDFTVAWWLSKKLRKMAGEGT